MTRSMCAPLRLPSYFFSARFSCALFFRTHSRCLCLFKIVCVARRHHLLCCLLGVWGVWGGGGNDDDTRETPSKEGNGDGGWAKKLILATANSANVLKTTKKKNLRSLHLYYIYIYIYMAIRARRTIYKDFIYI